MKESFTSIRHPVAVDTALGRLRQETDYAEHVEQMMRQILLTSPGERVNRPDFGCGVRRMVFEPNSEVSAGLVQVAVFEALRRWLGSAIAVDDVKVTAAGEVLEIKIAYVLKVRRERRHLNLEVNL